MSSTLILQTFLNLSRVSPILHLLLLLLVMTRSSSSSSSSVRLRRGHSHSHHPPPISSSPTVTLTSGAGLAVPPTVEFHHSNALQYYDPNFVHFNVGVLLVSGTGSGFDLEKCAPAVDMALDKINTEYLWHHKIQLHKVQSSYPTCNNKITPGLATDMKFLSNVIAFIGPACGFALEPVARLSAYWNIPVVTGLGDQPPSTESEVTDGDKLLGGLEKYRVNKTGVFGDKTEFPTLTRLSYCQCRLNLLFNAIFKRFNWNHVAIVYDKGDLFSFTVGRVLLNGLKEFGYDVNEFDIEGSVLSDMENALEAIKGQARIVIISLQEFLVREFMLKAHKKGLCTGEWAFFDVELFKNNPNETNNWQMGDKDDQDAKEAYEALITISLLVPKSPDWNDFTRNVKYRAKNDYNFQFPEDEEVNFFIGAFYDGVILLGKALNETLNQNLDIKDGRSVTLRMWNRTFEGITGNVSIDENGDRDAEFTILDMNPRTGKFEVVAYFTSQEGLVLLDGKMWWWPEGYTEAPLDVPECGFLGNDPKCLTKQFILPYIISIFLVFALLLTAVVLYVFKYMRDVEAENSTRWRIMPEDIRFETSEAKIGYGDERESSRVSLGTGNLYQNTFVPTVTYKGLMYGFRKIILTKRIEFTKQIIGEIRQVRDMQHENICRLIGLCLSSRDRKSISEKWDEVLILYEYCTRGSLRDVLQNVHIHLDWTFRLSLISDIVNGMTFLHSNFGPHGRLTSAKCLIDSRFVVKITDFGLTTIKNHENNTEAADGNESEYFLKLLWTGPEHLSSPNSSLKGDIYSFGIILYEVATRNLPYFTFVGLTPKDIIPKVAARMNPPFRPEISDDGPTEIKNLMSQCWADSPEDRPEFSTIKEVVRKLIKGNGTVSLVDDLLRRLEQHATHLEGLVEDKTRELEQEKRRSEDLLFQVLPYQVAKQLLRGEAVIPESFESVSIYFSDIVEFTVLCSRSTPIQVVDFLNNLYGLFDGILDNFDAYKVETIGDAYLVVSGAPQRNQNHASEIAYLSLAVLDTVKNYEIGHLPDEQLKIRIGIHTGGVCAGVVGHRMPHWCLFGDSVNIASRLESTGQALKIHISGTTARALEEAGGFLISPRGEIQLKGKGNFSTYWLEGCSEDKFWKRSSRRSATSRESLDNNKTSISGTSPSNFHFPTNSPSNYPTHIHIIPNIIPVMAASNSPE